jgi:hypothetical protein
MLKWLRRLFNERGSIGGIPLFAGLPGARFVTVSADAGALAAVTAVNIDVAVDGVVVGDLVWGLPPAALEVRIVLQGCTVIAGALVRMRFVNHSAAAAAGGAQNYNLVIVKRS